MARDERLQPLLLIQDLLLLPASKATVMIAIRPHSAAGLHDSLLVIVRLYVELGHHRRSRRMIDLMSLILAQGAGARDRLSSATHDFLLLAETN